MPGLVDFLGNLFGGGATPPPPTGGLTDPALYGGAPPELKLPFAYKLAMLGSSLNRSYGGRGGMDVGSLAQVYLQSQQDQYTWQTEQAERKRKLELLDKYLDKSGNSALKELAQADPDAALKLIFGIEAEKAKPQTPHTVNVKVPGGEGVWNQDTKTWDFKPEAPPPRDYRYLSEGGAAAPPTAVSPVPVAEARAASGDVAGGEVPAGSVAPVATVPPAAVVPEYVTPDVEGLTETAVKSIKAVDTNLGTTLSRLKKQREIIIQQAPYMDDKDIGTQLLDIEEERNRVIAEATKAQNQLALEDRNRQTAEKTAEAERKAKEITKVSAGETVVHLDPVTNKPTVIYKAQQNDNTDIANAKFLADPDVPEEQKKALREAMRSGTPLPPSVADQLAVKAGGLRLDDAHKIATGLIEEGNKAAPILGTFKTIETLIPGMTGGILKDPNSIPAGFLPGWNKNADLIKKANAYLAPQLRVIGSGSSSDADVNLNLASLATWMDSPEVNAAITAMAIGRFQIAKDRADLAMQYKTGKKSMDDFYAGLQEINNRDITPQLIKDMLADGRLKRDNAAPVTAAEDSITQELDNYLDSKGK